MIDYFTRHAWKNDDEADIRYTFAILDDTRAYAIRVRTDGSTPAIDSQELATMNTANGTTITIPLGDLTWGRLTGTVAGTIDTDKSTITWNLNSITWVKA